ncbi:ABC transporter [Intrasporangium chromatireducens Q5-1]|uniref:ABC transporter n=1 Tax=Intrasporangium chromatireducens Q5-1 TaxID=584657 RepID=W9GFM1_9MICO|nr:ABC transporter ATP-binding protein [Intrasporangium chromatireducens]EWT04996.1 ABC transporter [Intrasporangium chromatireducens Q5-1]
MGSTTTMNHHDSTAAIELTELGKTYGHGDTARVAVRSSTLSLPWGQVLGLLGPNGAGKTTLIKMICGLVTPTAGTVRIGGWDLATERSRAVLQIGAVLEGSRNVYWPLSAWENLLYFGRLKGLRTAETRPRAERLLRDLDLWGRRHEQVGSYSRGMQQKVAVATALITDPPILLLDEPTLGLDVESARTFKDWVAHLARDEHKTILLTTHQLHDVAQELSDRIAVIRDGEIIADLPTGELLKKYAEDRWEIRLAGAIDGLGVALPDGASFSTEADLTRVLLPTQTTDPYPVLDRIRATDAHLVSVAKAQPTLEEVFLRVLQKDAGPARVAGQVRS